ncbi:YifB family Mg chelatase-like AAA ATPase [Corynebacterium glyciniphilum]|uniref:YifB family Mg chelatase-like AAA ATPase n=1 Tax=Corynebacterium glyciniphilum TaxID=1404244 RepID=UPI0026F2684F|nr:YifB family Mg chelatase-like AAA ATPase [Corynebacterium glyciniphilum]
MTTFSERSPVRVGQARGMALSGVSGTPVMVECDISRGLPGMSIVGLGDTAVVQARDRVRSAMINSGLEWPKSRVVMSLSPASVPKRGSGFDLPMVLAILVAQGVVPAEESRSTIVLGELGLDGTVRPVDGVLPMLLAADRAGFCRAAVPRGNQVEASRAARVTGLEVVGLTHLRDLAPWIRSELVEAVDTGELQQRDVLPSSAPGPDLSEVCGQDEARRGLEIAAAGGHHLWLSGPPGSGKSMLAERLPGILPPLREDEQLETAAVHSVAGARDRLEQVWCGERPFVAPHHSVTRAALTGGGSGRIRPGAVSIAHNGVLFIDEAPEVAAGTLELLRTPMETGHIDVARHHGTVRFPARFQLVLASNPCPCGAAEPVDCRCRGGVRDRYLHRLSGPLLDRVDLSVCTWTDPTSCLVPAGDVAPVSGEPSARVRDRVTEARNRSVHRWKHWASNAAVPGPILRREYPADDAGMALLQEKLRVGVVSHRGVDRTLRVAWTMADLSGDVRPGTSQVLDALELYTSPVDRDGV